MFEAPQRPGPVERVPYLKQLAHMRKQPRDHVDLSGLPALRVGGADKLPADIRPVRPVQAHVQRILAAAHRKRFVVGAGGAQFRVGIEAGHVDQFAVGQGPDTGDALVPRVVNGEIRLFQVEAALAPVAEPGEVEPRAFRIMLPDEEVVARQAAGLVNERGGCRPQGIVQGSGVQGKQRAVEGIAWGHVASVLLSLRGCRVARDFLDAIFSRTLRR